jgi:hypothetical protein
MEKGIPVHFLNDLQSVIGISIRVMINTAAPDGTPPRRIRIYEFNIKNLLSRRASERP